MTEKMPLSKLNAHKIYNSVAKGILTLQQLAECYDCSYEQFIAECKRKVSQFEWKRILKADTRNQKMANDRKDNEKMTTRKYPRKSNAEKKQAIHAEMATVEEQLQISQAVFEDFQERVARAQKDEATAKRLYEETVQRRQWTEQNYSNAQAQMKRYEERMEQLQQKLDELVIWLVAPGYKGEMPRGRLVSVVPFEGYKVTVEEGDDLLNDVSFASMMELGFETLKEANTALEFAKLVLKYQLECGEDYKVLVDDERVITILRGQEVEI